MTVSEPEYRRLLRGTLITGALCSAVVLVCYFWIDRPVAFFVYRHHINTTRFSDGSLIRRQKFRIGRLWF